MEDLATAQQTIDSDPSNRRHVVNLIFDALEFTFYEILLLNEQDIYQTGQNTIGFDAALNACKKLGIDIPLIGTVLAIHKLRGDALRFTGNLC
jgi:hypothetical protein